MFYLFTVFLFSVPVTVCNEHSHGKSLDTSAYITHISTLTHTHTHLPKGAVVDNSLCSTPDASAGIVGFMLKQQQRTSAETFYDPCPTADLGWASLFQLLPSSTAAVEIPADPRSALKTDFTQLSSGGNRRGQRGSQI